MDSDFIPVAELFARLDLDASTLIEGLQNARIRLADISPEIVTANTALREMANTGAATEEELALVTAQLQLLYENQKQLTQARKNDVVAEREYAAEKREAIAQQKADEVEYANLLHQLREQEVVDERQVTTDKIAERRRYASTWNILLQQQEQAQEALNSSFARQVSLSPIAQQIAIAQAGGMAYRGMADEAEGASGRIVNSSFKVRTEAQALNEMIGTKIPSSISRMVAFQPEVAGFLNAIFDVALAGAFVDILYHVGEEIVTLTDYYIGFDKASVKAWEDADKGSVQATKDLIKYREMVLDTQVAGTKGKDRDQTKELVDIEKRSYIVDQLKAYQEQAKVIDLALQAARKREEAENRALLGSTAALALFEKLENRLQHVQSVEDLTKKWTDIQKLIKEASDESAKFREDIKRDEYKSESDKPTRQKRPRIPGAEDHERGYRLPSFQGPAAGQFGAGGLNASPGSPVHIGINITPQMHFNGVPADAQAFMRDHAGPELATIIQHDIRGIGTDIINALKEAGLQVAG